MNEVRHCGVETNGIHILFGLRPMRLAISQTLGRITAGGVSLTDKIAFSGKCNRTAEDNHYRSDARSFGGGILSLVRGCVSRHGCAGSRPRMSRPEEGKVIQDFLLELFEVKIDGRSDEKGDELRHNQPADHHEPQWPA